MYAVLAWEWWWETEGDRDDAGNICMADDDASDDLIDDSTEEATEDGPGESNGVDSEAGGSVVLALASRLQTGQKVLHEVSQESTQKAWNSVKTQGIYIEICYWNNLPRIIIVSEQYINFIPSYG